LKPPVAGFARIQQKRESTSTHLNSCEFSYERIGMNTKRHDYLRRLPPEHYRGRAYVHWSLTTEDRKTGWLIPVFYYKYREILTHTAFRFGLCSPIYCCMPDTFTCFGSAFSMIAINEKRSATFAHS